VSTAEHADALTRRIEQLAASSDEPEAEGAALAALVSALRAEAGAVGQRVDAVAEAVGGALESRMAVLEDALDGLSERIEALARDGASTTTDTLSTLTTTVRDLDVRIAQALETARTEAAEERAAAARLTASVRSDLDGFGAVLERLSGAVVAVRSDVASEIGVLADTVAGFRAEWPTRTFEVVQGAKAVAETLVRDVRTEIGAQLARVREELARAAAELQGARDGLESGTDRLSRAGTVLVGYLEQRDRLLEAERDRVLHDVLDSFAAGLSSRERTALAGRVGDVVARRRDARDAERYRGAVGQPLPPLVEVPDEVTRLVPDDAATAAAAAAAREARLRRAEAARAPQPPSTALGAPATTSGPAKRPARTVRALPGGRPPVPAAKAADAPAEVPAAPPGPAASPPPGTSGPPQHG